MLFICICVLFCLDLVLRLYLVVLELRLFWWIMWSFVVVCWIDTCFGWVVSWLTVVGFDVLTITVFVSYIVCYRCLDLVCFLVLEGCYHGCFCDIVNMVFYDCRCYLIWCNCVTWIWYWLIVFCDGRFWVLRIWWLMFVTCVKVCWFLLLWLFLKVCGHYRWLLLVFSLLFAFFNFALLECFDLIAGVLLNSSFDLCSLLLLGLTVDVLRYC